MIQHQPKTARVVEKCQWKENRKWHPEFQLLVDRQSGPLLLHRSAPVEVTAGMGRYARRSFIAVDKDGKLIVGVTDAVIGGLSFAELQELFSHPKWQMNAVELLNLDGGGSAQLYFKSGKFEEWLPGTADVPVAIGFFVKPK